MQTPSRWLWGVPPGPCPRLQHWGPLEKWTGYTVSILIPTQRPVPPGSIDGKSQERKRCKVDGGGGGG